RDLRLSTAPNARPLVSGFLDLLRTCLSDQEFARSNLSGSSFLFPRIILPRSTNPFSAAFSLELRGNLSGDGDSVVRMGRNPGARILTPTLGGRMARAFANISKRARER